MRNKSEFAARHTRSDKPPAFGPAPVLSERARARGPQHARSRSPTPTTSGRADALTPA
jgi:hypothetical protein